MSKQFVITLKVISFLVGLGYFIFIILPLIGNIIFTIGLGMISNKLSSPYILMYLAILFSVFILYLLVKIYRVEDGKKVLSFSLSLILIIFLYHFSLNLWSVNHKKSFELSKNQRLQENEIFLKDHCVKISEGDKSRSKTVYSCDDGTIR